MDGTEDHPILARQDKLRKISHVFAHIQNLVLKNYSQYDTIVKLDCLVLGGTNRWMRRKGEGDGG
jgi:hypothetical protein